MSGTFTGFSEEDIKNINSEKTETKIENKTVRRQVNAKRQQNMKPKTEKVAEVCPISDDAKLSKKEESNYQEPVALEETVATAETNEENTTKSINLNTVIFEIDKIEKKSIDLDEFQARQKLIEEQNRRRKELLAKALADRTKQTEEESRRLKEIQNEFKKLDALLSNDVAILRHQIEIASVDFMEAQKRYHKVEKEFLEAKLNLHQKLERKEMLTEHLCAIIEKNEERKADKLNELMARLTIGGIPISETIENENNKKKLSDNEIIYGVKAEINSDQPECNVINNSN